MPLTKKQRRQLRHIEASERKRGKSRAEAKKIARAVVYTEERERA
jgi:hypothetical protein